MSNFSYDSDDDFGVSQVNRRRARGGNNNYGDSKYSNSGSRGSQGGADGAVLQTRLFINGEFVEGRAGKRFPVYNPATGAVITEVAEAMPEDVDIAVRAANRAFETNWKYTDGSARRDILLKLADLMEYHREELATIETLDNGKTYSDALNVDVALGIKCVRYYAGWADKVSGKTCPVDGSFLSFTKHEAVGVVGQIIPWNFPLLMLIWKIAPCLAAGCVTVLKSAEQTPLSALRFAELAKEAGVPNGVLNIISGFGPTAGAALVDHPLVSKICFTGSTEVGKLIMAKAAPTLKRVTLELGGKSPLIINDDADLDAAVAASQVGVFFNQGQVCTASSRIFVHDRIYDQFVRKLVQAASKRTQGNGFKDVMMGPQVSDEQQRTVWRYIESGKQEGANCVLGGERIQSNGYFIQPTIFTDVTDDMKICREEIFGPVMSIMRFNTLEEAIKRANRSHYGLAAGVFSQNIDTVFKVANEVKAGTVWCNCYNAFDTAQPFGGFKQSGIGRELGEYALSMYTDVKTVMVKLADKPVKP